MAAVESFNYADYFAQISVLGDLMRDNPRRPWLTSMPSEPERAQYVVWLGCNVLRTVHIVETLDDILKHLGIDYVMLGGPANCCGVQHARRDQPEAGRRMAWSTFDKFELFQPDKLLFWCPSCDHRVMGMGDDVSELVADRQHVTEFFVEHLDLFDFKVELPPTKVAMHTHTGSPQQDLDARATRQLLSAIPGVEVVDVPAMTELGFHCASSEVVKMPPDTFRGILDRSIAQAQELGVDTLVTIYHACHRELLPASLDPDTAFGPIRVENYLTLLARSLGLPEHKDRYKHFVELGDPDLIMNELGPRVSELGLPPERARKFLAAQFGAFARKPTTA
jgi:Fe-S oxidoreductase